MIYISENILYIKIMKHENITVMNPAASLGSRILPMSLRLYICFPPNPIPLPIPKGNQYLECWVYCSFAFSNSFCCRCIYF